MRHFDGSTPPLSAREIHNTVRTFEDERQLLLNKQTLVLSPLLSINLQDEQTYCSKFDKHLEIDHSDCSLDEFSSPFPKRSSVASSSSCFHRVPRTVPRKRVGPAEVRHRPEISARETQPAIISRRIGKFKVRWQEAGAAATSISAAGGGKASLENKSYAR